MELGKAEVEILIDLKKMAATLKLIKKQVAMELQRAGEMGKAAFSKAISGIGKVLKTALIGVGALGAAVTAGAGLALHASNQLNTAMANVASLGSEAAAHVGEWKSQLQELSVQMAKTTSDLAKGLYQTVSAFGPVDDAMQILAINAKAATAGLAETADSINLTSAVTKAYGDISAKAVQQVADLALKTVQLGQTTFPELAQSIGRVTPLAAALHVSLQELFAVMATATGVTGDAAEVSTQMRAALSALMAPTNALARLYRKLGYANGQVMIKALGFGGAMKAIVDEAKKSGRPLQDFIGQVRGQVLALALANGLSDQYTEKLRAMQHAAGATDEAFRAQTQGIAQVSFQLRQLKQRAVVFLQKAGDAIAPFVSMALDRLAPALGKVADKIEAVLAAFHDMVTGSRRSFAQIHDNLTKVFGDEMGNKIFGFMDKLRQLINGLRHGGLMGERFRDALERVGGSGAVAAFDAIVNSVRAVKDAINNLWNVLEPFITGTVIPFVRRHGPAIAAAIAAIGAALAAAAIVSTVVEIAGAIAALANPVTLILGLIGLLAAAWREDWGRIRETVSSVANDVQRVISGVWAVLVKLGNAILKTLAPAIASISKQFSQVKALFKGLPLANLHKAFAALGQIVRHVAMVLGGVMLAALGLIVGAVRGIIQAVAGALPGLAMVFNGIALIIQGVIDVVAGAIEVLWALVQALLGKGSWNDVLAGFQQIWDGVGEIFNGVIQGILGAFYAFVGALIGLVSGLVTGVIDFFINLYDALVGHSIVPDMLQAMFNVFAAGLNAIIEFVVGWISGILGALEGFAANAISTLSSGFQTLVRWFTADIPKALSKVASFFSSKWAAISAAVKGAKEKITGALTKVRSSMTDKLNSALDSAKSHFSDWAKTIRDNFLDAWGKFKDAMEWARKNIPGVDLVFRGLQATFAALKEAVSEVWKGLKEMASWLGKIHIPKWAQRHSPSPIEQTFMGLREHLRSLAAMEIPAFARGLEALAQAPPAQSLLSRSTNISEHVTINAPGLDEAALVNLLEAQRVLRVMETP